MIRWLVAFALIALSAAALWRVRAAPQGDAQDEILVYEVAPGRTLTAHVPARLDELLVSTWALVPPDEPHDPEQLYQYAFEATLFDDEGRRQRSRRYELQTRISSAQGAAAGSRAFAVRLAESTNWVTDSRMTPVDVTALARTGGRIVLRPDPSQSLSLLFRLAHQDQRGDLHRRLFERRLRVSDRRRLVADHTSLGFYDLPFEAREQALAKWGRWVAASGQPGETYLARHLLIGSADRDIPIVETPPPSVAVGPQRWAALNFVGPVSLEVRATPGSRIWLDRVDRPRQKKTVGSAGSAVFDLPSEFARTVSVGAARPARIALSVKVDQAAHQIGDVPQVSHDDGVWLSPDTRVQRYLRLDGRTAVVTSVEPGQKLVGLTVRGLVSGQEPDAATRGVVRIRWVGALGAKPVSMGVELLPSLYETVGEQRVTLPRVARLTPPPGATALELLGSEHLLVSIWTVEPGEIVDQLHPAYAVPLPEGQSWQFVPYTLRGWAALRADNFAELASQERVVELTAQVRIEPEPEAVGQPFAARVLEAKGYQSRRSVLFPTTYSVRYPFPESAWTELDTSGTGNELRIADQGPRSARVPILFRADLSALGQNLKVSVDGSPVSSMRLVFAEGLVSVPAAPGLHRITLTGLGASGAAFAGAAPASGGPIVKRQTVYGLLPGESITLSFDHRAGELSAIWVSVVSLDQNEDFELRYAIKSAHGKPTTGSFSRRLTAADGVLSGRTGGAGRAWIWDDASGARSRFPDRLARSRIPLGDDLRVGAHQLKLRNVAGDGGPPLFVRAVLVGRRIE